MENMDIKDVTESNYYDQISTLTEHFLEWMSESLVKVKVRRVRFFIVAVAVDS
jgi:hypothetical protein